MGNNGLNGIDRLGLALYAFDGTKNVPADNTNVWLMSQAYQGSAFYERGIGNANQYSIFTRLIRQATGWGLTAKKNVMLRNLKKQIEEGDLDVDVIGFSRGAVTAIAFAEAVEKLKEEGVEPYCRLKEIRFMWLYDPVPGPAIVHRPAIPEFVSQTSIAYALNEKRSLFETKVYAGPSINSMGFRGGHSDIGGGYPADERGLADISLFWMTNEGISAVSPFGLTARPVSKLIRNQETGGSSGGIYSNRNLAVNKDPTVNQLVMNEVLIERNGKVNLDEILYKWR